MSTPGDSLIGKTFDDYRLEKSLGVGGMGKVYRALDVKLKRYVAIKVIASDLRSNPDYERRFEREAQAIARMEHPNIVRIYRFGEVDGMYYMAMQYIEGANLNSLIKDYRADGEVMPVGDVLRVIQDIGSALDYAHSRNLLHRDVKPGNIMVNQEGSALLTDFGLALTGDEGTLGAVMGSPYYVSPEQAASSANAVPQSDIYSLGVTLFEMLTGELPFQRDDVLELAMQHMTEAAPSPSKINAALPPSVDQVVLRALEKDPFDRYASGADMSAALQAAIGDWDKEEPPESAPARRPSLVMLPYKVHEQLQSSPLPAIPTEDAVTHVAPANDIATVAATTRNIQTNRWRGAWIFAAILVIAGVVAILALRQASGGTVPDVVSTDAFPTSASPTAEAVFLATAILPPTVPPTQILPPTPWPTTTAVNMTLPTAFVPSVAPTAVYELLIASERDDSMFVVNVGGAPIPLAPLRFSDRHPLSGSEWLLPSLGVGECVAAWKDRGNARQPDVSCLQVGERIERRGPERFWRDPAREPINVYYNEVLIGVCETNFCRITIPVNP